MKKIIELELRVKTLEKLLLEIISKNALKPYPKPTDIARFKLEALQELRTEYPDEEITYIH